MIPYNIKIVARLAFKDCTHFFIDKQGLAHGAMIDRCDKCQSEMICFETGGIGMSYGPLPSMKYDMREICKYLNLIEFDYLIFHGSSNVEDYSDEYQVVCDECADEIIFN